MTLNKKIKNVLLPMVMPMIAVAGMWIHNSYMYDSLPSKTKDGKIVSRADGIIGNTEFETKKDGLININRFSLDKSVFYTDKNGDDKVDRIHEIQRGEGTSYKLFRKKHLNKYLHIFKKADKDFKEQKARFSPYIR